MAYVPGFQNDLFLSYAHGDNAGGWISALHERLKIRLRELLGVSPAIWRDERRLGGETDFAEEIRLQVANTAVVIAVVSPSYLSSAYCRLERQAFSTAVQPHGGLKVGTSLRIVKVVKTPHGNDEHRLFLPEALGFEFFRSPGGRETGGRDSGERDFEELHPGEREFDDYVDRLARRLRDLLRQMCNQRQAIYVAEPPPELERPWESVREELSANGYRVLPEVRLDPFFAQEALEAELRPASLSVHLLGSQYDEFSVRQANLARKLEKPAVIWVADDQPLDQRQRAFLDTHAGFSGTGVRYAFLTTIRDWQLPRAVLDELKPRRERAAPVTNGAVSIYLICDRTDPEETSLALRLRDAIRTQENMHVFLPDVGKDPALLDEEHCGRLASCDGVLLYWGHGREEWFHENHVDVARASRRLRGSKPFRSEAIVLGIPDHPAKADVVGHLVIRCFDGPSLDRLEPFLAPLR